MRLQNLSPECIGEMGGTYDVLVRAVVFLPGGGRTGNSGVPRGVLRGELLSRSWMSMALYWVAPVLAFALGLPVCCTFALED